jgi:CRISPR/Cas system-associated endonuclease Cas1
MRLPDLGIDLVLGKRILDARDQISAIGLVIRMLKLASAALREMAARRHLVMWAGRQRTIVEESVPRHAEGHMATTRGDAVSACRDANDQFVHSIRASA